MSRMYVAENGTKYEYTTAHNAPDAKYEPHFQVGSLVTPRHGGAPGYGPEREYTARMSEIGAVLQMHFDNGQFRYYIMWRNQIRAFWVWEGFLQKA